MDTSELQEKLKVLLEKDTAILSNEPEVYYFALGYALNSVFAELGGTDQHRKEFNYLTNPYIPADVRTLSIRVLMFLKKINLHSKIQNKELIRIIDILLSSEECVFHQTKANLSLYERAFYAGLYMKNEFNL